MYFTIIASIEAHRIPAQKACLVFGIIGVILILLNITGEIRSRRMVREACKFQKQMEETTKEVQKQVEGSTKEMQKATEEATKALEELQKQIEKSKDKND